jgi:serine/threonine protein kinase
MTPDAEPVLPVLPGLRLLRLLHRGDASVIWQAIRESDGLPVTLKLAASDHPTLTQIARLRHEYEIGRGLEVPGLIRPLALETIDGAPVLVLEDFAGVVLFDEVRATPMPIDAFLRIAIQLADTIGRLHRQGVIHKDVKPHNIIWNAEKGIARLTDLGVASRLARERQDGVRTGRGTSPWRARSPTCLPSRPGAPAATSLRAPISMRSAPPSTRC